MESKYLVGYVRGRPALMWDKITDFIEETDGEGNVRITFKENGIDYEYKGTPDRGYKETHRKAPDISDYKCIGRRTALRHDYLNDRNRVPDEQVLWNRRGTAQSVPNPFSSRTSRTIETCHGPIEDDDDYEPVTINGDDGRSGCGGGYYRVRSRCGPDAIYSRGVCGGYTRVYGDGPCGAVTGSVCGIRRSYGCGSGSCGG